MIRVRSRSSVSEPRDTRFSMMVDRHTGQVFDLSKCGDLRASHWVMRDGRPFCLCEVVDVERPPADVPSTSGTGRVADAATDTGRPVPESFNPQGRLL